MPPAGTRIKIEEITEAQFRKQLGETYKDPEAAGRYFDRYVSERQKALEAFSAELGKNEALAASFTRNPIEMLNQRRLLGPLDRITLDELPNPFHLFPWPFPVCRLQCQIVFRTEVVWVCIGILRWRICWPVFRIVARWECRIVCSF